MNSNFFRFHTRRFRQIPAQTQICKLCSHFTDGSYNNSNMDHSSHYRPADENQASRSEPSRSNNGLNDLDCSDERNCKCNDMGSSFENYNIRHTYNGDHNGNKETIFMKSIHATERGAIDSNTSLEKLNRLSSKSMTILSPRKLEVESRLKNEPSIFKHLNEHELTDEICPAKPIDPRQSKSVHNLCLRTELSDTMGRRDGTSNSCQCEFVKTPIRTFSNPHTPTRITRMNLRVEAAALNRDSFDPCIESYWQGRYEKTEGSRCSNEENGGMPRYGSKWERARNSHLEKSILAKKRVIKMLFVLVFEFFICWTPIFILNILALYIPEQIYRTLGGYGISFLHLLAYTSACCNPITYCFMNRRFVQAFLHVFGCRKKPKPHIQRDIGCQITYRSAAKIPVRVLGANKSVRESSN